MKVNDIVYIIHKDHICRCTILSIQEDYRCDLHYGLYDHYHKKEIEYLIGEHFVFESIDALVNANMEDHR